ncbi:hypothetical protein HU200_031125 [Digitaria exilis]|uniref:Rx N-terminal domain-containing protein n=1 Tax=Digitaria exilis TaxID=1010633 RepID=A0A835C1I8_9POAL|nr:hypothetical protein HU200_031125 [Digitaria exilis]
MESQLLSEFISFLKARWPARSRVDERRRRLRQLVSMVRAVADAAECRGAVRDGSLSAWLHVLRAEALRGQELLEAPGLDAAAVAGSARRFLAGLKGLLIRSAEVDRLTAAVDELERLAGDLDMFVKVLGLDPARATEMEVRTTEMEVDGDGSHGAGVRRDEGSSSRVNSIAALAGLPSPGGKRKRAAAASSGADGDSSAHGNVDGTVQLPKRRVLAAPREPPPPVSRSRRARAVAKAIARIRRRIGKPATRCRQQESIDQRLSRISL